MKLIAHPDERPPLWHVLANGSRIACGIPVPETYRVAAHPKAVNAIDLCLECVVANDGRIPIGLRWGKNDSVWKV